MHLFVQINFNNQCYQMEKCKIRTYIMTIIIISEGYQLHMSVGSGHILHFTLWVYVYMVNLLTCTQQHLGH